MWHFIFSHSHPSKWIKVGMASLHYGFSRISREPLTCFFFQQWQWLRFYNLWQLLGLRSGDMTHTPDTCFCNSCRFSLSLLWLSSEKTEKADNYIRNPSSQITEFLRDVNDETNVLQLICQDLRSHSLWLHVTVKNYCIEMLSQVKWCHYIFRNIRILNSYYVIL